MKKLKRLEGGGRSSVTDNSGGGGVNNGRVEETLRGGGLGAGRGD